MIVSEADQYITPPRNIRVTMFSIRYDEEENGLVLSCEDMEDLFIPLHVPKLEREQVKKLL